jgi:HEAT repeat protein
MSDADQPTPELYRQAAEKLRELADQSHLPDIQGDLRDLAARFERMAAHYEAQRRQSAVRDIGKS